MKSEDIVNIRKLRNEFAHTQKAIYFNGIECSDCGAINSVWNGHNKDCLYIKNKRQRFSGFSDLIYDGSDATD